MDVGRIYRQTRIRWQLNAGKRPRLHPCVSRQITETLQNTGITAVTIAKTFTDASIAPRLLCELRYVFSTNCARLDCNEAPNQRIITFAERIYNLLMCAGLCPRARWTENTCNLAPKITANLRTNLRTVSTLTFWFIKCSMRLFISFVTLCNATAKRSFRPLRRRRDKRDWNIKDTIYLYACAKYNKIWAM